MTNSLRCKGILFDCDGVLVDSDASVLNSWHRWADDLGIDRQRVVDIMHGRRSEDTIAELLPEPEREAAIALIDKYEVEDAAAVTDIAGALALVTSLPRDRWAVVTSGTRALATARLEAAGIPLPDVLITADDVTRGKPDPQGYLAGARGLGLDPADVLVFEDAPSGLAAARAAGVGGVVGVGTRGGLDADVLVPDLTVVRWTGDCVTIEPGS